MRPVLRVDVHDGDFAFWPVAEMKSFGHLPLGGGLSPAEVGTAMMRIVGCNDIGPDPGEGFPLPSADPLGSFLHGLLTSEEPIAGGGLLVADTSSGVVVPPGCCCGLEDWREWQDVVDGGDPPWLGHDPQPTAERLGDTVRLTLDSGKSDGPVIELPACELARLLEGVDRDLSDFVALAADWASHHLPDHATPVVAALSRLLDLPSPTGPGQR
ncbi:hypothetical protein [Embleya sp. NPDC005971]|uniref:hypothetical protein n=1 Tax=Embleya sp. NPDC005971 TaxID=3156724 RepID=UPI0033C27814